MRKLFFSELTACKETKLHSAPHSWLPLEKGKLSKFASSSSIESLMKMPEPAVLPHFKPADYVDVLAQIHEELESCPPDEKSCLYLLQFQVFRGLGEAKLLRRSLQSAWEKASTIHEKLIFGAWLKYEKKGEEAISDLLSSCGKCSQEFKLLDFISQISTESHEMSYDDESDEFWGSPVVHFWIRDDMIACDRRKLAALSTPLYAMLNGGFRESHLEVIDMSRNGISPIGMRAISKFSLSGRLPYLSAEVILEMLDFANKFCCKGLKDACERKLASFVCSRQDAVDFMECALELGCSILAASCLQVLLNELPECLRLQCSEYMKQEASFSKCVNTNNNFMIRMCPNNINHLWSLDLGSLPHSICRLVGPRSPPQLAAPPAKPITCQLPLARLLSSPREART